MELVSKHTTHQVNGHLMALGGLTKDFLQTITCCIKTPRLHWVETDLQH